jgi:hypothetical protein
MTLSNIENNINIENNENNILTNDIKNNENEERISFSEIYKKRKEDFIKKTTKLKKYVKNIT